MQWHNDQTQVSVNENKIEDFLNLTVKFYYGLHLFAHS